MFEKDAINETPPLYCLATQKQPIATTTVYCYSNYNHLIQSCQAIINFISNIYYFRHFSEVELAVVQFCFKLCLLLLLATIM